MLGVLSLRTLRGRAQDFRLIGYRGLELKVFKALAVLLLSAALQSLLVLVLMLIVLIVWKPWFLRACFRHAALTQTDALQRAHTVGLRKKRVQVEKLLETCLSGVLYADAYRSKLRTSYEPTSAASCE